MELSSKKETGAVALINRLLDQCNVEKEVVTLDEVTADLIINLHESLLGDPLIDAIRSPSTQEDDAHNVQCAIDSLSLDILHMPMSHINGEDIVHGDKVALCYLIEVYAGIVEQLMSALQAEDDEEKEEEREQMLEDDEEEEEEEDESAEQHEDREEEEEQEEDMVSPQNEFPAATGFDPDSPRPASGEAADLSTMELIELGVEQRDGDDPGAATTPRDDTQELILLGVTRDPSGSEVGAGSEVSGAGSRVDSGHDGDAGSGVAARDRPASSDERVGRAQLSSKSRDSALSSPPLSQDVPPMTPHQRGEAPPLGEFGDIGEGRQAPERPGGRRRSDEKEEGLETRGKASNTFTHHVFHHTEPPKEQAHQEVQVPTPAAAAARGQHAARDDRRGESSRSGSDYDASSNSAKRDSDRDRRSGRAGKNGQPTRDSTLASLGGRTMHRQRAQDVSDSSIGHPSAINKATAAMSRSSVSEARPAPGTAPDAVFVRPSHRAGESSTRPYLNYEIKYNTVPFPTGDRGESTATQRRSANNAEERAAAAAKGEGRDAGSSQHRTEKLPDDSTERDVGRAESSRATREPAARKDAGRTGRGGEPPGDEGIIYATREHDAPMPSRGGGGGGGRRGNGKPYEKILDDVEKSLQLSQRLLDPIPIHSEHLMISPLRQSEYVDLRIGGNEEDDGADDGDDVHATHKSKKLPQASRKSDRDGYKLETQKRSMKRKIASAPPPKLMQPSSTIDPFKRPIGRPRATRRQVSGPSNHQRSAALISMARSMVTATSQRSRDVTRSSATGKGHDRLAGVFPTRCASARPSRLQKQDGRPRARSSSAPRRKQENVTTDEKKSSGVRAPERPEREKKRHVSFEKESKERRKAQQQRPISATRSSSPRAKRQPGTVLYPPARSRATTRERRRSVSVSPSVGRTPRSDDVPEDMLAQLLDEFPFLYLSHEAVHHMYEQQIRHLDAVKRITRNTSQARTKAQILLDEAEYRQALLARILKKERDHNIRLREKTDRESSQRSLQSQLQQQRQQSARLHRYYDDYQLQMRAKMTRQKTKEEVMFKRMFSEALELQKSELGS
ncbi:PREDICTED: centrosomal protein of 95 kDa-like [Priapulus caudatus]|uniref:Centrosomal protein of 95 kDa-like n=1 Tax=Priapulus caudatus TaxID=37621 RepID=A0ABM1E8W2_PRICU|nr:PREDICTED: centrosomal protein of 95 kDa-like [Priapulus caudatus]